MCIIEPETPVLAILLYFRFDIPFNRIIIPVIGMSLFIIKHNIFRQIKLFEFFQKVEKSEFLTTLCRFLKTTILYFLAINKKR